jgi:hypothetical protein
MDAVLTDKQRYALQHVVTGVTNSIVAPLNFAINGDCKEDLLAVVKGDVQWLSLVDLPTLVESELRSIYAGLAQDYPNGITRVKPGALDYSVQKRFTARLPWSPQEWPEQCWEALVTLAPQHLVTKP